MADMVDDDFGELYADVEAQVTAAINAVPSHSQVVQVSEESKSRSGGGDRIEAIGSDGSDSSSMEARDCGEGGGPKEARNEGYGCEKGLILGNGCCGHDDDDDDGDEDNDDLDIVLNEEDCAAASQVLRGEVGVGSDEEEDLVIVTEGGDESKERKIAEQQQILSDGLEQSSGLGADAGNGVKAGYQSQYSQYKYARHHIHRAAYRGNNKIIGSGSAASSCLVRGDWDANGSNQQLRSSLRPVTSCDITAFMMAGQSGCEFFLPRNRTIFDVNIESIGRKSWRLPGVDISDFFNFGLDEESWKQYCNCLEECRQQGSAANKSRSYQVYGAKYGEEPVAEKTALTQLGDTAHLVENADSRHLEFPKGRAIQVEDGIGERQPSMNLRRPRVRDSDAVIQISVQESSEMSKEEPGHRNDSENGCPPMNHDQNAQPARFDNELSRKFDVSSVNDGLCSMSRCSRSEDASSADSLNPDNEGDQQISDAVFSNERMKMRVCEESFKTIEMVNDKKEETDNGLSRSDVHKLESESSFGDRVEYASSPSYYNSRSVSYKAEVDSDKETICNPVNRTSSDSVNGLRESTTPNSYHSKDIENFDIETEAGDRKMDFVNLNHEEEKNHYPKLRLRSVAEVKIHAIDDETNSLSDGKVCYDGSHATQRDVKHRSRNFEFYDKDKNTYHKETVRSDDHRSGRPTKKHAGNDYDDFCHEKHPLRVEMDTYSRRIPRHEREYSVEDRFHRDNKVKQNKYDSYRERHSYEELRANSHVQSVQFTPESYVNFSQSRRKDDDLFERKNYDLAFDHRHREPFVKIDHQRTDSYGERERECLREKWNRHGRPYDWEMEGANRSERYWDSPHPDLLNDKCRSVVHDGEYRGHYNFEAWPNNSYRESSLSNGRGWQDSLSLKKDANSSRRIYQGDLDRWRKIHSPRERNNNFSDRFPRDDPIDDYLDDEWIYFGQSMTFDWPGGKLNTQSQGRVAAEKAFFPCGSSKCKSVNVKHGTSHVGTPFNAEQSKQDSKRQMREESKYSQVSDHDNSNFGMLERNEPADMRCRDSREHHLFDWKGKVKLGNPRLTRCTFVFVYEFSL
ncbi:hypothetical protein Sjap_006966 [Stephania japonica]|uniref:Pre-mRNA polyadenylation factor Fip1 domain-containing protein n=1 Tax=Stephania japonica TaxID=461633 RepID=A0AAP0K8L5_9MAGN